ncbi:MAG: hypothetical protein WA816_15210 [Bacteroidales bacterium]
MKIHKQIACLPYYFFFLLLFLVTAKFPFFWDTIQLASKHAHFFYDSGFSGIILPNEIDSGHIPTLGLYIALVWKIAGKSLLVSHIAMLPFVLGIVYQSIILVQRIFKENWSYSALIILLADPTLLAQCTLVSPDVLLVFFFLLALNNLLIKNSLLYSLALAGLTLSSMRGMMCVAGFYLAEVAIPFFNDNFIHDKQWLKKSFLNTINSAKLYLPSIIIAGAFFSWHFYKTGWIGYHKDMPWYPLFEIVDLKGAIRNILILGWRLIDFGRVFIWIAGLFCVWHFYKNRPVIPETLKSILVVLVCISVSLFHAVIFHNNLSGHRYLLPVYLLISVAVTQYIFSINFPWFLKRAVFIILFTGLLSGNFWIYPDRIAKGWDSTLAYLPYFALREEMMNYMVKENIPIDETGTLFPNSGQIDYIDLSGRKDSFAELDLKTNSYVFYSNIYNGFSDYELSELKNNWKELKNIRFLMVKVILYESPDKKIMSLTKKPYL